MKILIIGSNGQLGQALLKQLSVHNLIPINIAKILDWFRLKTRNEKMEIYKKSG